MPDILDSTGLQVKMLAEITADLTTAFQANYGNDINLDSNTPDGQILGVFAQAGVDARELILEVYNSFNPDKAIGIPLRERCAINNVFVNSGTYTITPIDVTVNQTMYLQGLDSSYNDPNGTGFTVSDNAGNQYILIDSTTLSSGTTSLNFRAKDIGLVQPGINTITNQVTVVIGVTSVNNSSGALQIGTDEETDPELRLRREQSTALNSLAWIDALTSDLYNISGVTEAYVHENLDDTTDINGIPAHGIWVIAKGGADTDIGNAIYNHHNYGNSKGSVNIPITTISGDTFVANFDRPVAENLYIQFNLKPTKSGATYDLTGIATYIQNNLTYLINEYAETSKITAIALAAIGSTTGNGVPIDVKISVLNSTSGYTWVDYITPANLNSQFTISSNNIFITVVS